MIELLVLVLLLLCVFEFEFDPFGTTIRGGGGVCKRGAINFGGISGGGGSGSGNGNGSWRCGVETVVSLRPILFTFETDFIGDSSAK